MEQPWKQSQQDKGPNIYNVTSSRRTGVEEQNKQNVSLNNSVRWNKKFDLTQFEDNFPQTMSTVSVPGGSDF